METNVGNGREKICIRNGRKPGGKNSNSGGKESINTGNYS